MENMISGIVNMEAVQKCFGEKSVLKNIDIHINKGEIFGLLGPSGAGKTTIIKILTGQLEASAGKAALFGVDTNKLTESIYKRIGMVLDQTGLYKRLSCYDNLLIFARLYNIDKSKINEVLDRVGLREASKLPVSKLSKGMSQRLVLARAIMHGPELLFLDEPTSGLDPATALSIHELLLELKEEGTTIFLTTHNMEEATKLCDHIALLNEGCIIEYDEPKTLCRKYNKENKICILLKDGKQVELRNNSDSAFQISQYFSEGQVESIHSTEPNLETVFITLTGRRLV